MTTNIQQEIENNEVLNEVQALLVSQTEKGIVKYGKTVTTNALTVEEWIEHLQQEHLDALVYSTVIKQIVCELNATKDKLISENKRLREALDLISKVQVRDGQSREHYQEICVYITKYAHEALEESK